MWDRLTLYPDIATNKKNKVISLNDIDINAQAHQATYFLQEIRRSWRRCLKASIPMKSIHYALWFSVDPSWWMIEVLSQRVSAHILVFQI